MESGERPLPSAPFAVTVDERQAALVVRAAGELDGSTVPRLRAIMLGVLGRPPALVVVDLSGVTFLGSCALHLLLEVQELAGMATEVRFVAHAPGTVKPLRITGTIAALDLYPTLSQALRLT
ncbi:anti-anti-sigma factor [Amycolatopsis endophytica]|uniref:Anti-sigma factor antagonist n=1 Tax=Amycolatopsis endophytica TaxID=860233 RepID=A0A853BAN7_9PSEU|nr:STAS domain-containing protein [Amycolatopsis endophytica]NYI92443.1 anti-anti-sigma factor [Amycolatopsis endophytica]